MVARFAAFVVWLLAVSAVSCTASAAPTPAPSRPTDAPVGGPAPAKVEKPSSATDPVADFYRGRTIKIIVGSSAGGGYDTYSRAIARHMGKHIPGNPTVVVENMPGAGSLLAAKHVFNVAPKDGTYIINFQSGIVGQQLYSTTDIGIDAAKFQYLGSPDRNTAVLFMSRRSGVSRLEELLTPNAKEVVLAGNAPGSMSVDAAVLVRDVLGARFKLVQGYPGSADVRLAIARGEADGFFNSWESMKITSLDEFERGEWSALLQIVDEPHRDLPNVPVIKDVARTDEQAVLLRFGYALPSQFARPYAVAPGVPMERVLALRRALERTLKDQEFLADAERGKLSIDPIPGEKQQRQIEEYLAMPADIRARLQKILAPGG